MHTSNCLKRRAGTLSEWSLGSRCGCKHQSYTKTSQTDIGRHAHQGIPHQDTQHHLVLPAAAFCIRQSSYRRQPQNPEQQLGSIRTASVLHERTDCQSTGSGKHWAPQTPLQFEFWGLRFGLAWWEQSAKTSQQHSQCTGGGVALTHDDMAKGENLYKEQAPQTALLLPLSVPACHLFHHHPPDQA